MEPSKTVVPLIEENLKQRPSPKTEGSTVTSFSNLKRQKPATVGKAMGREFLKQTPSTVDPSFKKTIEATLIQSSPKLDLKNKVTQNLTPSSPKPVLKQNLPSKASMPPKIPSLPETVTQILRQNDYDKPRCRDAIRLTEEGSKTYFELDKRDYSPSTSSVKEKESSSSQDKTLKMEEQSDNLKKEKDSTSFPFQTLRKRAFSLGKKKEVPSNANSDIQSLEFQILQKEIPITIIPESYDERYLKGIQVPDIKKGLQSIKKIQLSLPNNQSFTDLQEVLSALKDFLDSLDEKNTQNKDKKDNLALKVMMDLPIELKNYLAEALKYCDEKADSALRRIWRSTDTVVEFPNYSSYSLDCCLESVHIEISQEGFKISRLSKAKIAWIDKKKNKTTSVDIEYVISSQGQTSRVSKIHWQENTKDKEKKVFLEHLQTLIKEISSSK